ncbi:MAG TPA: phosphatidate cytidylyltransferase [Hyphomicrobiaceae bacterium]|nr:phosphatidate cytidylyltransferase [Hyphomicrobiaceae bacterium]
MQPQSPSPVSAAPQDLTARVASGLVLAAIAFALTWAGVWPFAIFVLAVAVLVAWEWGGIVRNAGIDTIFVVTAITLAAAVILAAAGTPGLGLIAIIVGAILAALLGFGDRGHLSSSGVLYAGLPAIALVWLRASPRLGFEAVIFLFVAVWATDTGAYVAGRVLGGPRLAPRISPNKTWAGLLGGIAAAVVTASVLALVMEGGGVRRMAVGALVLALVSQAGDIMESALKRGHGVKDASELIPGHGGFMDRVDGLVFAAVLAALFGLVVNVHDPARALLMWH